MASEVSEVGSKMHWQQVVLRQLWTGIGILHSQYNQIVQEANTIFQGYSSKLEAISKRVTYTSVRILAVNGMNSTIPKGMKDLMEWIDDVNNVLALSTKSLKEVHLKKEFCEDAFMMEDEICQIQEVNTGLTTAMEGYTISESSKNNFQNAPLANLEQPEPSGNVHPERRGYFERGSSVSS